MDWTSLIPVAGALLGGSSSGSSQQTQNRDPWSAPQPWMQSNLGLGQNLQAQYAANPFSQAQQTAYGNSAGTNNQIRTGANSIIGQLSNMPAFDRINPLNKPAPLDLSALAGSTTQMAAPTSTVNASLPAAVQNGFVQYQNANPMQRSSNLGLGGIAGNQTPGGVNDPASQFQSFMNTPQGMALAYAIGKPQNMMMGAQDPSQVSVQDAGLGTANPGGTHNMGYGMASDGQDRGYGGMGPGSSEGGGGDNIKGGLITKNKVAAPRNDGSPDNAYISAHTGEAVLNQGAVDHYGMKMIKAMNEQRFAKKG